MNMRAAQNAMPSPLLATWAHVPQAAAAAAAVQRRHVWRCSAARSSCPYEALGLPTSASADEIKAAFRKLALELHPDVNAAPNATEHFKLVKDAYKVLSDPQQRAAYNNKRSAQAQHSDVGRERYRHRSSQTAGSRVHDSAFYEQMLDNDVEDAAAAGFWGWYQQSGSWQSSWKANRKKQRQRQSAAQPPADPQQHQSGFENNAFKQQRQQQAALLSQLLSDLDAATLQVVHSVFGEDFEQLYDLGDLTEVLEDLEMLRRQGVVFGNAASSGTSSKSTNSSSPRPQSSSRRRGRADADSEGSANSRPGAQAGGRNRPAGSSTSSATAGKKHVDKHAKAGRQASTHSKRHQGKSGMRFDELSAEALYELMNDSSDVRAAKAARRWVQEGLAAKHLHPSVAARLGFMLATDYIAGEGGLQWPHDCVFGEMFNPDSERSKGRARAGSAYDYVRYGSSDDEDDGDNEYDDDQFEVSAFGSTTGWLNIEELFAAAVTSDWDSEADGSDESDSDAEDLLF